MYYSFYFFSILSWQASEKNQPEIVDYLVNVVKVNRNRKDPYERTPRDIAKYFRHKEVLEILDACDENQASLKER